MSADAFVCVECKQNEAQRDKVTCVACDDAFFSQRQRFTFVQCERCGVEAEVYKPRAAAWRCPCTKPLSEKVKHFNRRAKELHPSSWADEVATPDEKKLVYRFLADHPSLIEQLMHDSGTIRSRCSKYRTTVAWWLITLSKQDGRCAICQTTPDSPLRLFIDHDHESGAVRGLLCSSCNTGLGLLGIDGAGDVERASTVVQYLRTFRGARKMQIPTSGIA